jgi:hypothetical protein
MNTLKIDVYTKAVLTVIAACLVILVLQNGVPSPVSEAQAQAAAPVASQYTYANRPPSATDVATIGGVPFKPVQTASGVLALPVKIVEMPAVSIQKQP